MRPGRIEGLGADVMYCKPCDKPAPAAPVTFAQAILARAVVVAGDRFVEITASRDPDDGAWCLFAVDREERTYIFAREGWKRIELVERPS